MHLGNARTALLAWLACRSQGGTLLLRLEDLDRARIPAEAPGRLLDDLRALGLDWDPAPDASESSGIVVQSARQAHYDNAIRVLQERGLAYLCACSRADVARAAAAPHAADEGPRYSGTCRDQPAEVVAARARAQGRLPSVRFRSDGEAWAFTDDVHGPVSPMAQGVDDFVLRRSDGVAAYQLAVVVDDAAMGINQVVRGDDLLASTPRQLALYAALQQPVPTFAHVPLVLGRDGDRLAKRERPISVRALLAAGVSAPQLVGALAASAGLVAPGTSCWPRDLLAEFSWSRLRKQAVALDGHTLVTT